MDTVLLQAGRQALSPKAPCTPVPQTGQKEDVRRQTGRNSLARKQKFVQRQRVREFEYARAIVSNILESNRVQNMYAAERLGGEF